MSVRYLVTQREILDSFEGGKSTDCIAEILSQFEYYKFYYKEKQAEALEYVLTYLWTEFQWMRDVTVRLTEKYVSIYTSHTTGQPEEGYLECAISHNGDLMMTVGRTGGHSFGLKEYCPWDMVIWDRFKKEMQEYVYRSNLGSRR